jgi:hypothetical protein
MSASQNDVRFHPTLRNLWIINRAVTFIIIYGCIGQLNAGAATYNPDVVKWKEVRPTPKSRSADWSAWFYAANYSKIEWQVTRHGNEIRAQLTSNPVAQSSRRPKFVPRAEQFAGAFAVQRVDDGWLVAFNQGEFGAALYWFSHDGQQKYEISDDQVVDFMLTPQGIIAIQGLAHLTISEGSLIRIARHPRTHRWRASTIRKFSQAPDAFARLSDGTLIVVLEDSVVSLTPDNKLRTLIRSVDWGAFYPNSAVMSNDESKIYIGMRQYVAEFDLKGKRLRYLIPNRSFLNTLQKES